MKITWDGTRYLAESTYAERETLKAAGMRWDGAQKKVHVRAARRSRRVRYPCPSLFWNSPLVTEDDLRGPWTK